MLATPVLKIVGNESSKEWRWFDATAIAAVVSIASLVVDLLMIGWHRFLPILDYPAWLYEGHVFATWLQGHVIAGYRIVPYPVPNSTETVFLGLVPRLSA